MHRLVRQAKQTIEEWSSDEPRDLVNAVAALCRDTLDDGGLPQGQDWLKLRKIFDIEKGQSIGESIATWDDQCRFGNFELPSGSDAYVKLGIVTWNVKFIAKRLGMLVGSDPIPDFDEWKQRLFNCLDKYILVHANRGEL